MALDEWTEHRVGGVPLELEHRHTPSHVERRCVALDALVTQPGFVFSEGRVCQHVCACTVCSAHCTTQPHLTGWAWLRDTLIIRI